MVQCTSLVNLTIQQCPDDNVTPCIVDYLKEQGYDGIGYESDAYFEGAGGHNYAIFTKNYITPL